MIKLLTPEPQCRPSAADALKSPWIVCYQRLANFFSSKNIYQIIEIQSHEFNQEILPFLKRAESMVERLCSLGCPDNIAKDLSILTLYNIILIVRMYKFLLYNLHVLFLTRGAGQPRSPTTTAADRYINSPTLYGRTSANIDRLIDALLDIANLSQIKKKNPVSVPPWPYRSFIPWIWEIISLFLQPDMIFPSAGNLGGRQRDGVGYLYINITGVETSNVFMRIYTLNTFLSKLTLPLNPPRPVATTDAGPIGLI